MNKNTTAKKVKRYLTPPEVKMYKPVTTSAVRTRIAKELNAEGHHASPTYIYMILTSTSPIDTDLARMVIKKADKYLKMQ